MKNWIHLQIHNYEPKCESCGVSQYCGTMVSSIRLCKSVMKQKIIEKAMKELFDIIDIFPHTNTYGVGVIIKINQSYYLVDKADTFDVGWETMVFHCDEEGEITDWEELYTDRTDKSVWKCALEFAQKYFEDQLDTYINS